jgi:hypothetical protein
MNFRKNGKQKIGKYPEEAVKPRRGASFSFIGVDAGVEAKTGKSCNDRPGVSEPEGC